MSDSITTVQVDLAEKSYPIQIGTGNLHEIGPFLQSRHRTTHAVVLTDDNVVEPHARIVCEGLTEAGCRVDQLVLDPGEATKCVEACEAIWNKLPEIGADRKSVIVAVGGGVIGDLAGFIAATFARGLALLQVPTTLLAQVDSSVGGKVGVNLPAAKNMVGAFKQPVGVYIDTDVLVGLPDREYRAGLAEVVKYGVILDAEFFAYLEGHITELNERDAATLRYVIARCCRLKADVVEHDEFETTGLRAVLNYGHTYAHAFETLTGYGQLLHGEAVSIGMLCASRLAERLGRIDASLTARQQALLTALQLPIEVPQLDADAIIAAMGKDKKVEHGKLRFVLPSKLGHVELVGNVDRADVLAALIQD
jgi:3-dehydroquinate synthase